MPKPRHVAPKDGDVLLLVGTMKGAFLFRSDRRRKKWDMAGPYFPGLSVYDGSGDAECERSEQRSGSSAYVHGETSPPFVDCRRMPTARE